MGVGTQLMLRVVKKVVETFSTWLNWMVEYFSDASRIVGGFLGSVASCTPPSDRRFNHIFALVSVP